MPSPDRNPPPLNGIAELLFREHQRQQACIELALSHADPDPEPVYPISTIQIDDLARPPGWETADGGALTYESLRAAIDRLRDSGQVVSIQGVEFWETPSAPRSRAARPGQVPFKDEPDQ